MEDKISVIIPIYNVEPYLERCLDSIINNTYRNLEIICVDDGSTDNCGAILDRYAGFDERFVVIHKENGGVSSARNRALDVATGEFIGFVDPDDWVHPQYFKILMYLQNRENCDLVICGFDRLEEPVDYAEQYDLSNISGTWLDVEGIYKNRAARGYLWAKLYSRWLIGNKRFIEGVNFPEDSAFNALLFSSIENVKAYYITDPLYVYFDRPGSLVHSFKEMELITLAEVLLGYAKTSNSSITKAVLLVDAMKRGLAARYPLSLQYNKKTDVVRCNRMLRTAAHELWRMNVSAKKKLQYTAFVYIPYLYRLFRILDDPTLLAMERNLKKQK